MIVLAKDQLEKFHEIKKQFQEKLDSLGVDYRPHEIKGNLFVLPDECLSDKNFLEFYGGLVSDKNIVMDVRPIDEAEFIKYTGEVKPGMKIDEKTIDVQVIETNEDLSLEAKSQEDITEEKIVSKNIVMKYVGKFIDSIKTFFS